MATVHPHALRRAQAEEELGTTRVSARLGALFVTAVAFTVLAVPVIDSFGGEPIRWPGSLASAVADAAGADGPRQANRKLREGIARAEEQLADDSAVGRHAGPWVQWLLTVVLGAGNEEAYPGEAGWLFYRRDVDYAIGPPFLDTATDDPVAAILDFHHQLRARDIHLVVVPIPVKPVVVPHQLRPRAAAGTAHNVSFQAFVGRLRAAGVDLLDPSAELAAAPTEPYLHTDTHWTPDGLAIVATAIADHVVRLERALGPLRITRSQRLQVSGEGDTARLLGLPTGRGPYPQQSVEIERIESTDGQAWRPDPGAPVLLLGDSFANIYSDPALGWGASAGLAEQIGHRLRRPIDRIAVNAGGAFEARARLAADPDRLEGKEIVIYEFATRELTSGQWQRAALPISDQM